MEKAKSILVALAMILTLSLLPAVAQAACTGAIPTSAKANWLGGLFKKADTYKIAFYTDTATYSASTAQYSATNEVSGTNYSAGGFTLDNPAISVSGTAGIVDFDDEVNNTITFTSQSTCAMIYDSTASNSTCSASGTPYACCTGSTTGTCANAAIWIGTFSYIQPSAGTLTVTFPTADGTNAIVQLR